MRILLIHNDNLNENLVRNFDEENILLFSISNQSLLNPNFSFDKEAHEQLNDHFDENGSYDLIVLPFNLSPDNYLEFSGIQLANHIRLTKLWCHHKTPILFIGEESPAQIARIIRADILFTKGVFFTTKQTYEEILSLAEKLSASNFEISENNYDEIVNKLLLEPPNDYDSHHNLDNDFSLYIWSKSIGLELKTLKREIESGLYFKWWITKNKIQLDFSPEKLIEGTKSTIFFAGKKVLLIDDQYEKGWCTFFKKLLPTVEVDFLEGDFQKPDHFTGGMNIVDAAIDKIRIFDPHVVLLDLRLTDSDNANDIKELTGIKILKKFREFNNLNQGIQFITLSASNKIWNYEAFLNKKVSSFIIKKIDYQRTVITGINKNRELIYKKIKEADNLKKIFCDLEKLKNSLYESILSDEYAVQVVQLDLVFELVSKGVDSSRYYNFAFHVLFQVLEGFIKSNKIFERKGNEAYVIIKDKRVLVRKEFELIDNQLEVKELRYIKGKIVGNRPSPDEFKIQSYKFPKSKQSAYLDSFFVVMSILHVRLGLDANHKRIKKWININKKRNSKTGHGSNEKLNDIAINEIESFIEFLLFVFNAKNQNEDYTECYVNDFNTNYSKGSNKTVSNTLGDLWPKENK